MGLETELDACIPYVVPISLCKISVIFAFLINFQTASRDQPVTNFVIQALPCTSQVLPAYLRLLRQAAS